MNIRLTTLVIILVLVMTGGVFCGCTETSNKALPQTAEGKTTSIQTGGEIGQEGLHNEYTRRNENFSRSLHRSRTGREALSKQNGPLQESMGRRKTDSGSIQNGSRSPSETTKKVGGQVYTMGFCRPSCGTDNRDNSYTNKSKPANSFMITAYTIGPESTGKYPGDKGYGLTAKGDKAVVGITIAADWNVLPPGTRVHIEGVGERIVQDTGGLIKGNRIDLLMSTKDEAINWGKRYREIKVIE